MLIKIIKQIFYIGVSEKTDKNEIHYITFSNVLIIINGLAIFFYSPYLLLYLPDSGLFLIIVLSQFIFYMTGLVSNYYHHYFLSRNILCFTALIFTSVETILTGFYCDIHFFLLIGVIFAFFLFPDKEKKYSFFIASCFAFTYIFLEFHLSNSSQHPLPPFYIIKLKPVIRSSLLVLIFFFAYYSYWLIDRFQQELKSENIKMEREIELARNIQQQLIPLKNPNKNIFSLYRPMNQVGGDFYDFIMFRDSHKVGIFISDVSGHGVPAAFITTMIKIAINQSGQAKENPAELLMFLNSVLFQHSGGNFITVFYGILDIHTRFFKFSNGGHNSPFIIDSTGVHELQGVKSKPLAVMSNDVLIENNKEYINTEIYLTKKSKLLLYTDGLIETRSKKDNRQIYENSGMYQVLKDYYSLSCREFITNIYKDLVQFNGSENFEDDICMICLDIV